MTGQEEEKIRQEGRREQRLLYGGIGVIAGLVAIALLALAGGVPVGYILAAIIPVSALGATMIFKANALSVNRELFNWLDARDRSRSNALEEGQAAIREGQLWLAEKIEMASSAARGEHQQIRDAQRPLLNSTQALTGYLEELGERHADLERDVAQMAMWRRDVQKQTEGKLRIVPPPRDSGEPV